jgi:transcriptional regulator with XRE-family HTH domain
MHLGSILREARARAQLSPSLMSFMAGMDVQRLEQLEQDQGEPTAEELDTCARVFGVRMEEFVAGLAAEAPLTSLFFRSASEGGLDALHELVGSGAHLAIGEFMRCVRDLAELDARLGLPASAPLPEPPPALRGSTDVPPYGADKLADWFRSELGLGREPIDCMTRLLGETLGIRLIWATPDGDELYGIEGASTSFPRPAVLVNLVEGPDCWWRTRMTLGHELCHLLCDHEPGNRRFAIFSPEALRERATGPQVLTGHTTRWHVYHGFERIEQRAGAFAACLLAPADAVKQAVGVLDPISEEAIALVGKTFGLGRITAINRLQHVFRFSKQVRQSMVSRSTQSWQRWRQWLHPDQVRTGIGLRAGAVANLALDAFVQGRIDRVEVRDYLNLSLMDPLPEHPGLDDAQRAPLRHPQDRVRRVAQQYLQEVEDVWDCFATTVCTAEGGWRVEVARQTGDTLVPCGHILVSRDLSIARVEMEAGI